MNNKISSIAAALVAKAGTNASAGVGALKAESTGADARKRVTNCMHTNSPNLSNNLECNETTGSCEHKQHQIGTNLVELSVCWHKTTWSEHCHKCGEPFYKANQYTCEKCNSDDLVAGTLRNDFYDAKHDSMNKKKGLTPNQTFSNSSNLLSMIETNNSLFSGKNLFNASDSLTKELPLVEYLTRKNFEDEFSSMIINSTCASNEFLQSFQSIPKHDITKSIASVPSILTEKDLIGQIKLYNKYNNSKFTELNYELDDQNSVLVTGLLKIHWHLKQPIQLSSTFDVSDDSSEQSLTSNKSDKQTDFKATLINENNQKKNCFDDSSIDRKNIANRRYSENKGLNGATIRAHTVHCKPNKWKRPALHLPSDATTRDNETKENQKFIPAYASVSSIRIDSQVTCLKAIQILLEKYHIVNSAVKYSLYKCYQSGETRELSDNDQPLIERVWMGPFSEDKIFIMEKGRQLNTNQEVSNLVSLPETLLHNLLDNLNQEEDKEMNRIKTRYSKYKHNLESNLEEIKNNTMNNSKNSGQIEAINSMVTKCSM